MMNANAKRRPPQDYAVGYRRPPVRSQFRKGQSGNPRGRPPGRTRDIPFTPLDQVIRNAINGPLSMTVNGKKVTTTRLDGVLQRLIADALRGDHQATRILAQLIRDHGVSLQPVPSESSDANGRVWTDKDRARAVMALFARVQATGESEALAAAHDKSTSEAA